MASWDSSSSSHLMDFPADPLESAHDNTEGGSPGKNQEYEKRIQENEKKILNLEFRVANLERGILPSITRQEDNIIPSYTGGAIPVHVFEFLNQMDQMFKRNVIPEEEHGRIIISNTTSIAKQTLENFFYPEDLFPSAQKVREVLITSFGKIRLIIKIFNIEHQKIGQIPTMESNNVEQVFQIASQHEKLILRFQKLSARDQNEDFRPHYNKTMTTLLPARELNFYLQRSFRMDDKARTHFLHDIIKDLKEEVTYQKSELDILRVTFCENENNMSFVTQPKPNQKSKKAKSKVQKYPCNELTISQCPLCEHLDKFAVVPWTRMHCMNPTTNNPITESCPHIASKNIISKNSLLTRFKFCKICLFVPISKKHLESECKFLDKFSNLKCKHKNCSMRASLCLEHQALNRPKQLSKQKDFSECGITYVI